QLSGKSGNEVYCLQCIYTFSIKKHPLPTYRKNSRPFERLPAFLYNKLKYIHKGAHTMPGHNKLVRDNIPKIIKQSGKTCTPEILDDESYVIEIKKKLKGEVNEYFEAPNNEQALEELADILELIHALSRVHGASIDQIEHIREDKAKKRGGFDQKVFLIEVEDE